MSDFTTIWKLVSAVPEGHVVTYGQIARKLGNSRASRLVVWALHQAPPDVPCHRVVNKSGQLSTAFQPLEDKPTRCFWNVKGFDSLNRKLWICKHINGSIPTLQRIMETCHAAKNNRCFSRAWPC